MEGELYRKIRNYIEQFKKEFGVTDMNMVDVELVQKVLDEAKKDFPDWMDFMRNASFWETQYELAVTEWFKNWFGDGEVKV